MLVNVFENRSSTRYEIKGYDKAWIEFYDDALGEFLMKRDNIKPDDIEEFGYETSCHLIADWNLSDQEGKMEINEANIRRLPISIQKFIAEKVGEIIRGDDEKKKDSSGGSQEDLEEEQSP